MKQTQRSPTKSNSPSKNRKISEGGLVRSTREIRTICQDLGIDYENERERYGDFVNELLEKHSLDVRVWARFLDVQGRVCYKHLESNQIYTQHPLIKEFRDIFHRLREAELEHDVAAVRRPKIEFPIKSEKVHFDTIFDQRGHTKSLLSLLRQSDRRYNAAEHGEDSELLDLQQVEKLLQECKTFYEQKYGAVLLRLPEHVLAGGNVTPGVPEMPEGCGPYEIARNLQILGVGAKEYYLFFLGRAYQSLELPLHWERRYDSVTQREYFVHALTHFEFFVHPAYLYLAHSVEELRGQRETLLRRYYVYYSAFRIMKFRDQLLREYEIDMGDLLTELKNLFEQEDLEEKRRLERERNKKRRERHLKQKLATLSSKRAALLKKLNGGAQQAEAAAQPLGQERESKERAKTELAKVEQLLQKLDTIAKQGEMHIANQQIHEEEEQQEQEEDEEPENDLEEDQADMLVQGENGKRIRKVPDIVILSVAEQLALETHEAHLLMEVEDFVRKSLDHTVWRYKITEQPQNGQQQDDGEIDLGNAVVWINRLNKRAQTAYPQLNELELHLEGIRADIAPMAADARNYKPGFLEKVAQTNALAGINRQKHEYVKFLVERRLSRTKRGVTDIAYNRTEEMEYSFSILQEKLQIQREDLTMEQYMRLLYYCPFNMVRYVQDLPVAAKAATVQEVAEQLSAQESNAASGTRKSSRERSSNSKKRGTAVDKDQTAIDAGEEIFLQVRKDAELQARREARLSIIKQGRELLGEMPEGIALVTTTNDGEARQRLIKSVQKIVEKNRAKIEQLRRAATGQSGDPVSALDLSKANEEQSPATTSKHSNGKRSVAGCKKKKNLLKKSPHLTTQHSSQQQSVDENSSEQEEEDDLRGGASPGSRNFSAAAGGEAQGSPRNRSPGQGSPRKASKKKANKKKKKNQGQGLEQQRNLSQSGVGGLAMNLAVSLKLNALGEVEQENQEGDSDYVTDSDEDLSEEDEEESDSLLEDEELAESEEEESESDKAAAQEEEQMRVMQMYASKWEEMKLKQQQERAKQEQERLRQLKEEQERLEQEEIKKQDPLLKYISKQRLEVIDKYIEQYKKDVVQREMLARRLGGGGAAAMTLPQEMHTEKFNSLKDILKKQMIVKKIRSAINRQSQNLPTIDLQEGLAQLLDEKTQSPSNESIQIEPIEQLLLQTDQEDSESQQMHTASARGSKTADYKKRTSTLAKKQSYKTTHNFYAGNARPLLAKSKIGRNGVSKDKDQSKKTMNRSNSEMVTSFELEARRALKALNAPAANLLPLLVQQDKTQIYKLQKEIPERKNKVQNANIKQTPATIKEASNENSKRESQSNLLLLAGSEHRERPSSARSGAGRNSAAAFFELDQSLLARLREVVLREQDGYSARPSTVQNLADPFEATEAQEARTDNKKKANTVSATEEQDNIATVQKQQQVQPQIFQKDAYIEEVDEVAGEKAYLSQHHDSTDLNENTLHQGNNNSDHPSSQVPADLQQKDSQPANALLRRSSRQDTLLQDSTPAAETRSSKRQTIVDSAGVTYSAHVQRSSVLTHINQVQDSQISQYRTLFNVFKQNQHSAEADHNTPSEDLSQQPSPTEDYNTATQKYILLHKDKPIIAQQQQRVQSQPTLFKMRSLSSTGRLIATKDIIHKHGGAVKRNKQISSPIERLANACIDTLLLERRADTQIAQEALQEFKSETAYLRNKLLKLLLKITPLRQQNVNDTVISDEIAKSARLELLAILKSKDREPFKYYYVQDEQEPPTQTVPVQRTETIIHSMLSIQQDLNFGTTGHLKKSLSALKPLIMDVRSGGLQSQYTKNSQLPRLQNQNQIRSKRSASSNPSLATLSHKIIQ